MGIQRPAPRWNPCRRKSRESVGSLWTSWLLVVLVLILPQLISPAFSLAQGSEADVLVTEAILAYDEQRYDEALGLLKEAQQLAPEHLETNYYLGLVYLAQGRAELAIPPLEQARQVSPESLPVMYQLGVAHFSLEHFDEAEPLLTRVFEERPDTPNLAYYVGFMRYLQKDYQGALRAFEQEQSSDPRIQQLTKSYSGLSLAILGLPSQAASALAEANRVRTVSPVIGPADRLRDSLVQTRVQENRFHGQVRIGGFYDTNVPVVPLDTSDPTVSTLRSRDTNSSGELASVHLAYDWIRQGPLDSTVSYTFFQTYNNDLPAFNVQNHLIAFDASYRGLLFSMPSQTGLQLTFDHTTLGDDDFLNRFSANAYFTLVESARHLTTLQARAQSKDFKQKGLSSLASIIPAFGEDVRDATNWMAGISHIVRFADGKHLIRLGYQFDSDRAIGDNFDYNGHRLLAGLEVTLPWWAQRLSYNYDVHFRDYDHKNTRFSKTGVLPFGAEPEVRQKVTEQNHVVRLQQPLPYNLTWTIDWQGTFSRSNIDLLFRFNRHVISSSLTWVF